MKYKAVSEFVNGKQQKVNIGDPVEKSDYSEKTMTVYLKRGLVAEEKAVKPSKNKQAKPTKNK